MAQPARVPLRQNQQPDSIGGKWSYGHIQWYSSEMKNRVLNVTEFKANCLALLDDIGRRGGSLTITKRGRPLATVLPADEAAWKSPEGSWAGKVVLRTDPLGMETAHLWDVLSSEPERE